ncbi:MAG: hypothetical protein ACTSWY_10140, partial [Promethearchaeota archaeon]
IFYNDKEINKSQYEKLLISIINKSSLQIIIHYKFEFGNVRHPMKLSFFKFLKEYDFIRVITHMIRVIKKKAEKLGEKDGKKEKYLINNINPILSNIFYEDYNPFGCTHTQDEKELIYAILETDPPMDLFLKNYTFFYVVKETKPSFIFKYLQKVCHINNFLYGEFNELNKSCKKIISTIINMGFPIEDIANENMEFLILFDFIRPGILTEYLQKFKRDYVVGVKKRNGSLIKNLTNALDFVYKQYYNHYTHELKEHGRKIVSAVLDINPSLELFAGNHKFLELFSVVS